MRPKKFYACFLDGIIIAVVEGQAAALTVCGGRRHYRSFKSELDAEEFAAWWNYRQHLAAELRALPRDKRLAAP